MENSMVKTKLLMCPTQARCILIGVLTTGPAVRECPQSEIFTDVMAKLYRKWQSMPCIASTCIRDISLFLRDTCGSQIQNQVES